jgi:4-hydroxybenzoate polyprenyltransferase
MIGVVSAWAVTLSMLVLTVYLLVSALLYSLHNPQEARTRPDQIIAMGVGFLFGILMGGMIVGSTWITFS